MKIICKFLATLLVSITSLANAGPLNPNGPETKQLEAMGYEVKRSDNGSLTIASISSTRLLFDKNDERLVIFRMFTANTKKNDQQRLEILEILNKINVENSYQVSIEDGALNVALYKFGSYDAKTFAAIVRLIEKSNTLFDTHPKLIELLK
jgi:hypothetical protein